MNTSALTGVQTLSSLCAFLGSVLVCLGDRCLWRGCVGRGKHPILLISGESLAVGPHSTGSGNRPLATLELTRVSFLLVW